MDFDGDGIQDIVSGGYMGVPFFIRGTAEGWANPIVLRDRENKHLETGRYWDPDSKKHSDGKIPQGGSKDRAYAALAVDWDADGDLDLLRGTSKGYLVLRLNEGSQGQAAFATKSEALGIQLPGGYAMPVAIDWDGDGLWDLISGDKKGGVYWFKNSGTKGAPKFEGTATQLVPSSEEEGKGRASHAQVEVCDWDGDSDLDLLVGDRAGYVWLYRNEK